MCRESNASPDFSAATELPRTQDTPTELGWQLQEEGDFWRMSVAVSNKPSVEVKAHAVRVQLETDAAATAPIVLPVPAEARPVDLKTATCAYYKKKRELVVRWSRGTSDPVVVLERLQVKCDEISNLVNAVERKFMSGELQAGRAMDDLAQLEAQLDKLQCKGVDGVDLGGSTTDAAQGAAKAKRKNLTATNELLHQKIDKMFGMMRAARSEDSSAQQHDTTTAEHDDVVTTSCEVSAASAVSEEAAQQLVEDSSDSDAITSDDSAPAESSTEAPDLTPSDASTEVAAEELVETPSKDSKSAISSVSEENPVDSTTPAAADAGAAPPLPSKSADEWKALGNVAVSAGDHAAALESYSAGLEVDPNHAILLSNRALCFHKLGRLEEGLEDARRCAELRPDFAKSYIRGAMILQELKRPQEALELLRKAPPHEEVERLSAQVRPEAQAAEERRIASLSGAEQKKEQGNALFKKGLFEQALRVYDEALDMCTDPQGHLALSIRNNRAGCYHQLSDFSQVIKDTSIVLECEPDNLKARVRRMLAYEPLEKYVAALNDARHVLSKCPGNEQANKVQHRLSKVVREMQRD
jgi:tetratricopeptide (TPR) repeat protein